MTSRHVVQIVVSEQEKKYLDNQAVKLGTSASKLGRKMLLKSMHHEEGYAAHLDAYHASALVERGEARDMEEGLKVVRAFRGEWD